MPSPRVQYIPGTVAPTVEVEGLEEALAMFDDLPKVVILAGFAGALLAAGNVFVEELDPRVPIQLAYEGGDLVVAGGDLKSALMLTDPEVDSGYRGGSIEAGFGKLGYVANMVEYGHRMVSHAKKEISGPKTPAGFVQAYPFIRPAFDTGKERSIDAFVNSLANTVNRFKAKWGLPTAA